MKTLLAIAYFMALGYLAAKTKMDEAAAKVIRQAFRAVVTEALAIEREVNPRPLGFIPVDSETMRAWAERQMVSSHIMPPNIPASDMPPEVASG